MSRSAVHTILFAIAIAGCGVQGVEQDAAAVVLHETLPKANPEGGAEAKAHKDDILVGSEVDHEVPVHIEWTVAKDAAACLRVQRVTLTRTGGPTSTEIYDAKVKELSDGQCVGADIPAPGGAQPDLIDRVNVSYCWRWNGAANKTECAYSAGFTIRADMAKVEGIVKRAGG